MPKKNTSSTITKIILSLVVIIIIAGIAAYAGSSERSQVQGQKNYVIGDGGLSFEQVFPEELIALKTELLGGFADKCPLGDFGAFNFCLGGTGNTSQSGGGTPSGPITWGYISDVKDPAPAGPNTLIAAKALGVSDFRFFTSLQNPASQYVPYATMIRNAGMGLSLTLINASTTGVNVAAPSSVSLFQTRVASYLDTLKPESLVSDENEADSASNYPPQMSPGVPATPDQIADRSLAPQIAAATAASYIAEQKAFVDVAHSTGAYAGQSRHYQVATLNLSYRGGVRAYWYYLWTSGQHAAADAFEKPFDVSHLGDLVYKDLPNSDSPDTPIFANNQSAYLHMLTAYDMIEAAHAVPADYVDVHAFVRGTVDIQGTAATFQWIKNTVGKPMVSMASGQISTSSSVTNEVANLAVQLQMPIFFYFSSPNAMRANIVTEDDGVTLNSSGQALAAFIKAHP